MPTGEDEDELPGEVLTQVKVGKAPQPPLVGDCNVGHNRNDRKVLSKGHLSKGPDCPANAKDVVCRVMGQFNRDKPVNVAPFWVV